MFVAATPDQARAVLGATRAVIESTPRHDARSGLGAALVVAAGAALFRPPVFVDPEHLDDLERVSPPKLALALGGDPELTHHAAALLAVASLADGVVDPDRLREVVRYAHTLHVDEGWVRDLHEVARGHLAWAMGDMARRNVDTFPGLVRRPDVLPALQPYRDQTDDDRRLAERFAALETLDPDTFGHAFWRHFRRHGFAFPGEPEAFDGHFAVPHDGLHVLSGYSTSLQGELLVSTFTGAMMGGDGVRAHLLPVIFEWHVGTEVNGIGAQVGNLDPRKLLAAWTRGETMSTDVLDPTWDFWSVAGADLEELRATYDIVPLDPMFAASGPEIVVEATADPQVD